MKIKEIINKEFSMFAQYEVKDELEFFIREYFPDGKFKNLPRRNQLKWLDGEFKKLSNCEDINNLINKLYERSFKDTFKNTWKAEINCSKLSNIEFYKVIIVLLAQIRDKMKENNIPINLVVEALVIYIDEILLKQEGDK